MNKTIRRGIESKNLRCTEEDVPMQNKVPLECRPELTGFTVLDLPEWPSDSEVSDTSHNYHVIDIGLSACASPENIDKLHTRIATAILDFLSECPEAFELLRLRTFARTLSAVSRRFDDGAGPHSSPAPVLQPFPISGLCPSTQQLRGGSAD